MKTFRDYLTEAETWSRSPRTGDGFEINIREETLIETVVHSTREDAVILAADTGMMRILESYHMLSESVSVEEVELRDGSVVDVRVEYDLDTDSYDVESAVDVATGQDVTGSMTRDGYNRVLDAIGAHLAAEREQSRGDGSEIANLRDLERQLGEDENQRGLDHAYAVYGNRQGYYAWRKSPPSPVLNIGITDPQLTGLTDFDPRSPEILDFVKQHMKPVNFNSLSAGIKQLILKELPLRKQGMAEGAMSDIDMDLRHIAKTARMDGLVDAMRGEFGIQTQQYLQDMMDDVEHNLERRGMQDTNMQAKLSMLMDAIRELYAQEDLDEAEYQGRKVQLNKPMQGDVAKFKVYVKDPSTGNVKKVNFGDKTMRIKKSNPARRRSFRARHRCENPGPKTKARYWSCRKW